MVAVAAAPRIEARVLEVVERLVVELGTPLPRGRVELDDALDRDLGLGSLERVELLFRLEQAFGIRFDDTVLGEAERVRDLVAAVDATGVTAAPPAVGESAAVGPAAVLTAGVPAPLTAGTLVDVLRWHVERAPEKVHVLLRLEDGSEHPITHRALWTEALAIAAGLRKRGVAAGSSVALLLRTEPAFFPTFFGVLAAGAVPVPIYPPFRADRLEEYAARQVKILDNAQARLLVTFRETERLAALLRARVRSLVGVVTPDHLAASDTPALPPREPRDAALIQYTSGSTGDPKGVLLSHANLLANIRALGTALGVRPDDVMVSWLPLYHDMGLIGAWLGSLYHGVPVVIMSPLAFLARPARWLRAISAHRATISAAPNFAFDLCVRRVTDEEMAGVELDCWRLAMNGSEAVSAETLERFTRRFASHGFRAEALCPVYGLAESAVGLTISPPGRGARIDRISRDTFERTRRAAPAGAAERAPLAVVSCGVPLPHHEVRIVDATGRAVPERVEGRVEFRGPSVTRGYFRNPAATAAVVRDGWMDSGDLGYWSEGQLYITGRRKDLIIKAGRNLHPQEVEALVGDVAGVRKGCVAAFGVGDPDSGTERLIVVAETRVPAGEAARRLDAVIRERVVDALGLPPDVIVLASPGSVLKTSSGKIRRSATREAWARGELGRRASPRMQRVRLVTAALRAQAAGAWQGARRLLFGLRVGTILVTTLPPLWLLVLLLPGRAVDRSVRAWSRLALWLAGCRLRVEGAERLPAGGSLVLAANHASYLDAVVLFASIPRDFRFVAKREVLRWPLVGRVVRKTGHLTVERADPARSVEDAQRVTDALRAGQALLFFPEGTFLRPPEVRPFRLGAFKSAADVGCPVVPVAIRGTRAILPAGAWLPRPGSVSVSFAAPIAPEQGHWRDIVRLRDRARAEISRGAGERAA